MKQNLEWQLGMRCMDFIFYYPAQFRGVDSDGNPQLFAFCGAMVQEISNNFDVYTLCGGLSQTNNGFLLSGGQDKSNASFADPLNFGITNKNAEAQQKSRINVPPLSRQRQLLRQLPLCPQRQLSIRLF